MKIKDQFMRAIVGGLIAGLVKDIPDLLIVDLLKIKHLAFVDYVGVMIFSKTPHSILNHLVDLSIEVAFSLGLGIIYAMVIIPKFPTKYYLIRGTIYGSACWFILMSVVKLFNVHDLIDRTIITPLATLLFSAGYGLLLAFLDNYFTPEKQRFGSW